MYKLNKQLIIRAPAFTFEKYREADLDDLLADPYFKAAVYLASKTLYSELEKRGFNAQALTPNLVHTLRKYLNRMCFRPTPFGLFSGYSPIRWGGEGRQKLTLNRDSFSVQAAVSFGVVLKLAGELLTHELAALHTYRKNASLYGAADEYRFLRSEMGEGKGRRSFRIDSLDSHGLLKAVFRFCDIARDKSSVVAFIHAHTAAPAADCAAFFEQLVEQQLLVSTLEANITGTGYLDRLLALCKSLYLDTPRVRALVTLQQKLKQLEQVADVKRISAVSGQLEHAAQQTEGMKSTLYVNLHTGPVTGGLSRSYQPSLLDGITCLAKLVPSSEPRGLQKFSSSFHKKFENRSMPLLTALDPELGVGYEDLAGSFSVPKLLQGLAFPVGGAEQPGAAWSPAHALLLERWSASGGAPAVVRLTAEDLEQLDAAGGTPVLSPSISMLFRVVDEHVYIEQAGGASATALIGRFTPLHPDVAQLSRTVARNEKEANPGVIFAEIAHICDEHTANIDRRSIVRDFEIPVLVQSVMPPEQQIPLSDLWVRVQEDKVVLFSKRLRKVIVPRLGSAFNYVRNDLTVFRFLCDLQYQGIKSNFTLDLSHFFPGMSYYPRVVYKSAILHLATWHVKKDQLISVLGVPKEQGLGQLQLLANQLKWPRHIALTEHDNQLIFDLESESDLTLLLHALKGKENVTVKEFPFAANREQAVLDTLGKPYLHQFLAILHHDKEVYPNHDLDLGDLQKGAERKRKLLPGNGWLYFKIYCHPTRSNQLLSGVLLPVVKRLIRKGDVKKWFYVRYRDPGYHVRVRFSVSPESLGSLIQVINQKLSRLVRKGTVTDFQVAVYERELERYGPNLIEAAEDVFCASSDLVAATIRQNGLDETDYAYYKAAFSGLHEMADAFKLGLDERVRFFHSLYQAFYAEFEGDKALREQLSQKFREMSKMAGTMLHPEPDAGGAEVPSLRRLQARHVASHQAIARKAVQPARRQKLLADLMHMHLNRLFVDDARKQELVVYYCLWKFSVSALARSRR